MAGTRKKAAATGTRGTATKGRAATKRGVATKSGIATKRAAKSKRGVAGQRAVTAAKSKPSKAPAPALSPAALRTRLAQRETELALINSIQQGLAAKLDFQAVVDLIGDQLRVLFATPDLSISWFDESANLVRTLYAYEHGRRLELPPNAPRPGGLYESMRKSRVPHVFNRSRDYKRYNLTPVPGTDNSKSMLSVPIVVGDRFLGDISIENFERENAFAPSDIRLVSTVAGSLGAALENARLFDETQRLLEETKQRAAELAVINSVQQGMAEHLEFQSIVDLVGDKVSAGTTRRRTSATTCIPTSTASG
jgi:GAF domain-containing protein